ncbi:hypothetical protein GMOD_00006736 [Pyrenophora seminiperda CCB06]|uniref:Uncharacterized protein n=1 Tax=Pyrenophora seminiperda CCB06 TaxID=1302712 RepID=A0A3M7MAN9_9PLEO|nr:hypothetical protein GMOD_00006736 [Pyrenophora seminiperda CCB06]
MQVVRKGVGGPSNLCNLIVAP